MGAMSSPVRGADGNVEFFVWARAHAGSGLAPDTAAIAALHEFGGDVGGDRP
jgi:hypothetical protein